MSSVDGFVSGHAAGHGALVVLLLAFALGLRHASDPDHLVAVSTLVADTRGRAARAAARLGAAWGLGHAATLLAFGLPVLLLRSFLPHVVEQSAEALIGVIIVVLAARLLLRWRRGAYHVHVHAHEGRTHAHVHSHAREAGHVHDHAVRTPAKAFAIGLVHGTAGSAGVAVLLIAAIPSTALACAALVVLVLGCALSMALMSAAVGGALNAATARRRLVRAIPVLGSLALAFGAWYVVAALQSF
jgi:ABC-type nickel/cobalt efflux system permease component RcnA